MGFYYLAIFVEDIDKFNIYDLTTYMNLTCVDPYLGPIIDDGYKARKYILEGKLRTLRALQNKQYTITEKSRVIEYSYSTLESEYMKNSNSIEKLILPIRKN